MFEEIKHETMLMILKRLSFFHGHELGYFAHYNNLEIAHDRPEKNRVVHSSRLGSSVGTFALSLLAFLMLTLALIRAGISAAIKASKIVSLRHRSDLTCESGLSIILYRRCQALMQSAKGRPSTSSHGHRKPSSNTHFPFYTFNIAQD